MKTIYLEEFKKYCVILECKYDDNVWRIIAANESKEIALEEALKKIETVHNECVNLLEKLGEVLLGNCEFYLDKRCDIMEMSTNVKFKKPIEIDNELIEEFNCVYFNNEKFSPLI